MVSEDRRNQLSQRILWKALERQALATLIKNARGEDLTPAGRHGVFRYRGDVSTALLPEGAKGRAHLVAREPIVLCGMGLIELVLEAYGGEVHCKQCIQDGTRVERGAVLAELEGSVSVLLQAERVLLNFLQKLSGVATETASYVSALDGSRTRLLDTRKTTPGYRLLEKYAVATGGGWNHRFGLYDRVMFKDNHLAVTGATGDSLAKLCRRAKSCYADLIVEVEVDHLGQIEPLLEAGVDVILLDNFSDADLQMALAQIGERAATEASGGITLERLPRLAHLGLDFISTGATVHQSRWKDIGLDWQ